jgi:hypothetical protein
MMKMYFSMMLICGIFLSFVLTDNDQSIQQISLANNSYTIILASYNTLLIVDPTGLLSFCEFGGAFGIYNNRDFICAKMLNIKELQNLPQAVNHYRQNP